MKTYEEIVLVNYCHPDCIPLMNIMRLPKEQAFQLARSMAEKHPETTAFYRFADFENYYELRKNQDAYLYARFVELGGLPEEKHPLSFVVENSDYLREWFGNGIETRVFLKDIASCYISFTIGDSGALFQKNGKVDLLTVEDMERSIAEYGGDFDAFMQATGMHYIEAQLWSDKYVDKCKVLREEKENES